MLLLCLEHHPLCGCLVIPYFTPSYYDFHGRISHAFAWDVLRVLYSSLDCATDIIVLLLPRAYRGVGIIGPDSRATFLAMYLP